MKFPCERCGACCRAIRCKYLKGRNECTVYEIRPEICRVDHMISKLGLGDRRVEFHNMTKAICRQLRERF